ncbi:MAG TPA: hypothetical protein GX700_03150 [Paracoccus sp.]|nr:hypothetical protein [Paracoccus sp. (in: a-proteobacteria)]
MRIIAALICAALLSACAAPGQVPVTPAEARQDRIARECRVLEMAHGEMATRGENPAPDILVGCPGHEALRDEMTMAQMSAATRRANAAVPPAQVGALGGRADMVYRRMITRGVSPAVAARMAGTPEFAAASL